MCQESYKTFLIISPILSVFFETLPSLNNQPRISNPVFRSFFSTSPKQVLPKFKISSSFLDGSHFLPESKNLNCDDVFFSFFKHLLLGLDLNQGVQILVYSSIL